MDEVPKELEEHQLNLQVVVDPETKCFTMKTHIDGLPDDEYIVSNEVIPSDPLHHAGIGEQIDWDKMSELDRLIYSERQRLLNLKPCKNFDIVKTHKKKRSYYADIFETDSNHALSHNEKSKLRMRKFREEESSEERELRKFRVRIYTLKSRLLQKLKNFEDETFFKEISKRNSNRVKQKRLEIKANETPAQKEIRQCRVNLKSRLMHLRRKVFQTPAEILSEKEKRSLYMQKVRARHTQEQLKAKQKIQREKAKEMRKKNQNEWKKIQMVIRGTEIAKSEKEQE